MGGGKAPLAFLGKKSWHTKNLRNVERVWIAEEREKAEQRKLEELRKQIEEEREMVELRKLQEGAGIGKGGGEKVDWMYEGPMAETGTGGAGGTAAADEEYLLGKEYKPADKGMQDVAAPQHAGALLSAAQKPNVNDAFSRMHEDPLLLIRQKQMQARESVVKNPLKMSKVKQEIEAQLLREREDKKARKREKKEAKKARKREKKEAKKSRKRSPSPSASTSSTEAAEAKPARRDRDARDAQEEAPPAVRSRPDDGGKYGLQSGKRSTYSEGELGPSAELIANAKKAEPARPVKRSRHERPAMTEEERRRKLREMQRDADDREVYRDEMIRKEKAEASREEEKTQTRTPGSEAAGFIRDMERESIREMDVEDRVKRNRHFQQRGADAGTFLRK